MEELAALEEQIAEASKVGQPDSPKAPSKDSIFKFFREIIHTKDSSKVANLSKIELGNLNHSVRFYQRVSIYSEEEGLKTISSYFSRLGEIILATSMSKKGFLDQLFVTQIKKEQKMDKPVGKKPWFGLGKSVDEGEG